ncbi:uncharacterized protein LOC133905453 isoform X2 [Phragmites australis]|uniref:uncharacterized protein LOC133905453 isoform X2 n=1 Tax=Phragmites australis TaxID=29695 RepID=UPI002D7A01B0|nr:uncharacterized protein LOC133905453 isoform X2 [Phragmites australis]
MKRVSADLGGGETKWNVDYLSVVGFSSQQPFVRPLRFGVPLAVDDPSPLSFPPHPSVDPAAALRRSFPTLSCILASSNQANRRCRPSFPTPGAVTVCDISRDLGLAQSISPFELRLCALCSVDSICLGLSQLRWMPCSTAAPSTPTAMSSSVRGWSSALSLSSPMLFSPTASLLLLRAHQQLGSL